MPAQRIHIENLTIRLRRGGVTAREARDVAAGFGREILRRLAEGAVGRTGAARIDAVTTGVTRAANRTAAIPRDAAEKVAAEVRRRLNAGENAR